MPLPNKLVAVFTIAVSTLLVAGQSEATIIDSFEVGGTALSSLDSMGVEQLQTGLDPNAVVRGERFVSVSTIFNRGDGFGASLEVSTASGDATLSTDADSTGNFALRYGSLTDPLGIDLTTEGADRFLIEFSRLPDDLSDVFRVAFSVDSPNGTAVVFLNSLLGDISPAGVIELPFRGFLAGVVGNVRAIELSARLASGTSISVADIRTGGPIVPEPTSFTMIVSLTWLAFGWRAMR